MSQTNSKLRFLITAGPTREYIDTVRYISNASSGKMGYACAHAARNRGHQVTLISGPVALPAPEGIKTLQVTSSEEMANRTLSEFESCDIVIMTAAVCDYKAKHKQDQKIKKTSDSLNLELVKTTDILKTLGSQKTHQKLIGFALEDETPKENAQKKYIEKKLDLIVLNAPSVIGQNKTSVEILDSADNWSTYESLSKDDLADLLISKAENL